MAWVAVDKDGTEAMYHHKPYRSKECFNLYFIKLRIELPKGSIKKLIGRDLTWEDNPVELKEE